MRIKPTYVLQDISSPFLMFKEFKEISYLSFSPFQSFSLTKYFGCSPLSYGRVKWKTNKEDTKVMLQTDIDYTRAGIAIDVFHDQVSSNICITIKLPYKERASRDKTFHLDQPVPWLPTHKEIYSLSSLFFLCVPEQATTIDICHYQVSNPGFCGCGALM